MSKRSKSCVVWTIRFCSNSTSMWSSTSQKIMERLKTSDVSISDGNIKYPIEKSIFAVNLLLKLFRVAVGNADLESLKTLHSFLEIFVPCTHAGAF